jgi:hypothetical protein
LKNEFQDAIEILELLGYNVESSWNDEIRVEWHSKNMQKQ